MIVPDVNLLIYSYNSDAPHHERARAWWESALSERRPVGISWMVALGFVRLMTHPAVLVRPLDARACLGHVRAWLKRPQAIILEPGPRHLDILEDLLAAVGAAGNLTSDAHLAAIAIEHQGELYSNDVDFGRFPGLRWRNPL